MSLHEIFSYSLLLGAVSDLCRNMEQMVNCCSENMWTSDNGRLENGTCTHSINQAVERCGVGFNWPTVVTILIGISLSILTIVGNVTVRESNGQTVLVQFYKKICSWKLDCLQISYGKLNKSIKMNDSFLMLICLGYLHFHEKQKATNNHQLLHHLPLYCRPLSWMFLHPIPDLPHHLRQHLAIFRQHL